MDAFLAALPKVELHVHLEGSLRAPVRTLLAERHRVPLTEEVTATRFGDFDSFVAAFVAGFELLQTGEDLLTVITHLAADLAGDGIRYAEVTTTAFSHLVTHRMPAPEYRAALDEGRRLARRDHGVELAWIIDIPRGFEPPDAGVTIGLLAGPHCPEGTVAIGLGGPERGHPPHRFADPFARARALGLGSVPHAGETGGAAYVAEALDVLHPDRIGHGVMCLEDPVVVDRLVTGGVPLELAVTSNVLLGVAPSVVAHPVAELLARGVAVSLNTDDPGYFDTTLTAELALVARHHGLGPARLRDLQLGAVDASFAPVALKAGLREAIGAVAVPAA